MNSWRKSAPFGKIILSFVLLSLGACDSTNVSMPHVFGGNEVPPEVMAEPRVVAQPSESLKADQTYLRLGDVPSMPKNFTSQPMIEATKQQLTNERIESDVDRDKYQEPLQGRTSVATSPSTTSLPSTPQP